MKFLKYYKKYSLFLFAVIALTGYGAIVVSAIAPGQTLDPVGDNLCDGPGDPDCDIAFSSGGGSLTSSQIGFGSDENLLTGNANFVWDDINQFLGIGTGSPLAQLHIQTGQVLVPGTPTIPATPGYIASIDYTGSGLDDAEFSGEYDGVDGCFLVFGIWDTAPDNGFANDRIAYGGNCGVLDIPDDVIEITPNVPMPLVDLNFSGISVTFTSGTGHSPLVLDGGGQPLDNFYYLTFAEGSPEIPGTPDVYEDASVDKFLVTNFLGEELFKINQSGNVSIQRPTGVPDAPLFSVLDTDDQIFSVFSGDNGYISMVKKAIFGNSDMSINGVDYIWTGSQGGVGTVLTNDGSGNLTWEAGGGSESLFTLDDNHNLFDKRAGNDSITGSDNIFSGRYAGFSNTTGNSNIFLGSGTGASNTDGFENIAIGGNALASNIGGYRNTSIGVNSLYGNTTGTYNTATGFSSLASNTAGSQNSAFGLQALYSNTTGNNNTALGYQAGFANTTSTDNVFIGKNAGYHFNGLGGNNIFVGSQAGENNTIGYYNIFSGYNAGASSTTGASNTIIGATADVAVGNTANAIALGYGAVASSNEFALPDDVTNWKFSGESYTLPVNGTLSIAGVLTNDGTGGLTWEPAGGGGSSPISIGGDNDDTLYSDALGAGLGDLTAGGNIFLGAGAGSGFSGAYYSNFIGRQTGLGSNASYSNFLGVSTGSGASDANNSNFIGFSAGQNAIYANSSIFIGNQAGMTDFTSGSTLSNNSIFIGNNAGFKVGDLDLDNTGGDTSILIGDDTSTGGFSNSIAIGKNAINTNENQFTVGDSYTNWKIGGVEYVLPGANGSGVLTNNGSGNLTWAAGGGNSPLTLDLMANLFDNRAGNGTMTGNDNLFLGAGAGNFNTTGANNVFLGQNAGIWNTIGSNNVFLGFTAGMNQEGNDDQIAIGAEALRGSSTPANNTGTGNIAIGHRAGWSNTQGGNNYYFGYGAGSATTSGLDNIFFGYQSGGSNEAGNYNLLLGHYNDMGGIGVNNAILVGHNNSANGFNKTIMLGWGETATAANQMVWDEDITTWRFQGDTYTLPTAYPGASGYALVSSDAGVLSWADTDLFLSDERMKSNVNDLGNNVLSKLNSIRTVTYTLNSDQTERTQIGFLAQNLETVFPELVGERYDGYKGVYYAQMAPILVEAIRELDLKLTGIQDLSDETLLSRIRNWFADAGNGIQSFFAKEIYTEQICVAKSDGTDFCINGDQLESVMNGSGNQIIYTSNNNQNDSGDVDEPVVDEPSHNEELEEINDSFESDTDMETDVDSGDANIDESPSEDQSTQDDAPTESSPEQDTESDSSSESSDAGHDSGAESGAGIDE